MDAATRSVTVSPGPPPPPDAAFFGERRTPADLLVAEIDGAVVGYVAIRQAVALASHAHVLEISGLAVDPAHQGAGVGRRLVEAALADARARGARKVSLRVLASNAGARRLYERCGFVVEGVLRDEFRLDGRFVDDVLMARRLAPDP